MLAFSDSVWGLILGNGLVAFFSGAFNPTRQALTNELLPPPLIPRANSVLSMSFAFIHALLRIGLPVWRSFVRADHQPDELCFPKVAPDL